MPKTSPRFEHTAIADALDSLNVTRQAVHGTKLFELKSAAAIAELTGSVASSGDFQSRCVAPDLQALAAVVRRLIASPAGDARDAEFDIVEHELALLSSDEQAQVRPVAGLGPGDGSS